MVFMLVPTGGAEWEDMRIFTTYSAVEQVMKRGIEERRAKNKHVEWCFVVQYEGTDEVRPVFTYHITESGNIIRTIPSL
jgi:hypothetical protein